jgi:hypothetical protein
MPSNKQQMSEGEQQDADYTPENDSDDFDSEEEHIYRKAFTLHSFGVVSCIVSNQLRGLLFGLGITKASESRDQGKTSKEPRWRVFTGTMYSMSTCPPPPPSGRLVRRLWLMPPGKPWFAITTPTTIDWETRSTPTFFEGGEVAEDFENLHLECSYPKRIWSTSRALFWTWAIDYSLLREIFTFSMIDWPTQRPPSKLTRGWSRVEAATSTPLTPILGQVLHPTSIML